MKKIRKKDIVLIVKTVSFMAALLCIVLIAASPALAAFGDDVEKPKPVFTREGDAITAKLTPRAKSTSVIIRFEAAGGKLTDVQAMDFASAKRPEVDNKDFRCDLFAIAIENIPTGGEISVAARSDFFTSSTRFWLFNPGGTPAWSDARAQHQLYPDRVREMAFTVRDGGPFDTDNATNGKILLTGGPKDSFWGYAIGTLFIRFFGVFLVLGVLMIGMMVCGKIFETVDKHKSSSAAAASAQSHIMTAQAPTAVIAEATVEPEMAAAIALALHLEMTGPVVAGETAVGDSQSAWNLYGRQKIMSDRLRVFNRHSHS